MNSLHGVEVFAKWLHYYSKNEYFLHLIQIKKFVKRKIMLVSKKLRTFAPGTKTKN